MTADQEYLRPNLRANLLSVFSENRKHEDGGIRLFEIGKVFLPIPEELPAEPEALCAILGGTRLEKSWSGATEPLDFFDARGLAESLLYRIGVVASFEPGKDESLYPSRQASIVIDNVPSGIFGEFHPKVLDAFEIAEPVFLFEINMTLLSGFTTAHKMYQSVSRYPDTVRDMALVVDTGVNHQNITDIIGSFSLVSQVELFDVYSGDQVPTGKKSLAYRIVYQSPTHTLTDEEVNKVQEKILKKLSKELGAVLRS
jgi:phenylalanyl-tRNA synthetase beta chain